MTRYSSARHYRWFGLSAVDRRGRLRLAGTDYVPAAYMPAALFLLTAGLLLFLAFRPRYRNSRRIRFHRRPHHPLDGHPPPGPHRLDLSADHPHHAVRRFADAPGLSRRSRFLQQPAPPSAPALPRRPDRRHPVPPVLGRSAGSGQRAQTGYALPATAFCARRTKPKSSAYTSG